MVIAAANVTGAPINSDVFVTPLVVMSDNILSIPGSAEPGSMIMRV